MIDFKKEIAQLLEKQNTGLSAEEIEQIVEVPADKSRGEYAYAIIDVTGFNADAEEAVSKIGGIIRYRVIK